jgi:hypothetical protein
MIGFVFVLVFGFQLLIRWDDRRDRKKSDPDKNKYTEDVFHDEDDWYKN